MVKTIITDIEGTTSSISFVHDVLFPYARARIKAFILANAHLPEVKLQIDEIRSIEGKALSLEHVGDVLLNWIDSDKKVTPLKALQGMIWQSGYENGDFTGHVYKDAIECLQAWHASGVALYVFSSGSVKAQKLLFGFSDGGDLTPLFSGYFDTNIGAKRDVQAYMNILKEIKCVADEVLFLSDIVEELDAAKAAGMRTTFLDRDGHAGTPGAHRIAHHFREISIN